MTSHPYAAEAADINTAPERLAELANDRALQAVIAANPATPADILETLSMAKHARIRRAVVTNPNAVVLTLLRLAIEFPGEFLLNPVLPLLNISHPDFMKSANFQVWLALLRCENIPPLWLQWLRQGAVNLPRRTLDQYILPALRAHVAVAGEVTNAQDAHTHTQAALEQYTQETARFLVTPTLFLNAGLALPHLAVNTLVTLPAGYYAQKKLIIAYSPNISAEALAALSREEEVSIQRAVACHPRTPPDVLTRLASADPVVRRAVANNPHVPLSLLQQLAHDEHTDVRCAVAHYHRTPLDILETLALDPDTPVREAVAGHHALNNDLYRFLGSDSEPALRAALARNVHAPEDVLTMLTYDQEPAVRAAAARNPHLPTSLFSELVKDPVGEVRAGLARNPQLPPDLFGQLEHDAFPAVRRQLAANPRAPLSFLHTLQQEGGMETWTQIARNPHITPEQLTWLAQQGDEKVQAAVASHKRTPVDTLVWLAKDPDYTIWRALASNPHTPLVILQEALAINYINLGPRIAHHPAVKRHSEQLFLESFAEALKAEMARNSPSWLRQMLLSYPDLPPLLLDVFANSLLWVERYLAAQHPAMPRWSLKKLAHDGNRYVRAAARSALERHAAQKETV